MIRIITALSIINVRNPTKFLAPRVFSVPNSTGGEEQALGGNIHQVLT